MFEDESKISGHGGAAANRGRGKASRQGWSTRVMGVCERQTHVIRQGKDWQ